MKIFNSLKLKCAFVTFSHRKFQKFKLYEKFNNKPWVRARVVVRKRNFPNFPTKHFPIKVFDVFVCVPHFSISLLLSFFCTAFNKEEKNNEIKSSAKKSYQRKEKCRKFDGRTTKFFPHDKMWWKECQNKI